MKISQPSNHILLSNDQKLLFNVGGTANIFDISNDKLVKLKQFSNLKNSTEIAKSTDEKLIAYKNTSGHVAVHNVETGELILKNKCLAKKGGSLFFIDNNRKILSSEWGGKIFTLDIESKQIDILMDVETHLTDIFATDKENEYIFFTFDKPKYEEQPMPTKISKIDIMQKHIINFEDNKRRVFDSCVFLFNNKHYFFSGNYKDDSDEISLLDFTSNKIDAVINVQQAFKDKYNLTPEYGYFTSICIGNEGKYLIAGFSDCLMIFDLEERALLNAVSIKYLCSLNFILADTKVVIGTWDGINIVDFSTLLLIKKL